MAQQLNAQADVIGKAQALAMNIQAAMGLASVLKSNLGPRGTLKMLVGGAGQIKLTKDGKSLLDEMQIQHPTAALIARQATAQDDITGDGTTSSVIFIGELLKQADRYFSEGLHPRIMAEGFELAREEVMKFLDDFKVKREFDRAALVDVARSSVMTKVDTELALHLTEIIVDSVLCIRQKGMSNTEEGEEIDLHMIELMHMKNGAALDTRFVNGLVLDHGARHPGMAKRSEKCFIFVCNVSLEYEKTMVNSGFYYKDASERQKMVESERKFTDDKVRQIIAFKQSICTNGETFILINQKGIDPVSLDMLQKAGIVGIRRAKRRNMERLERACGGYPVNTLEDLKKECCGFADLTYEHTLGDDKYTFVEGCAKATSCTILVKGPNDHTIAQIKGAIRDGQRAVQNALRDRSVVAGAGAFEIAAYKHLLKFMDTVEGRAKIGVKAFAEALLVIPKTLASNSGLDSQTVLIDVLDEIKKNPGARMGVDLNSGKAMLPERVGVWDNYCVKKQFIHLGSVLAVNLMLVDEIMRAGKKMGKEQ